LSLVGLLSVEPVDGGLGDWGWSEEVLLDVHLGTHLVHLWSNSWDLASLWSEWSGRHLWSFNDLVLDLVGSFGHHQTRLLWGFDFDSLCSDLVV